MMNNILFFLLPKSQVEYVLDTFTIRQTMEKMDYHHYSAIPVLNKKGNYVETISDSDIIKLIKDNDLNLDVTLKTIVKDVSHIRKTDPIQIDKSMDDLIEIIENQNFVPVVDDMDHFIGIITRKSVIEYMSKELKK